MNTGAKKEAPSLQRLGITVTSGFGLPHYPGIAGTPLLEEKINEMKATFEAKSKKLSPSKRVIPPHRRSK